MNSEINSKNNSTSNSGLGASIAAGGEAPRNRELEQALKNARTQTSIGNYPAIYAGFQEKGIPVEEIQPRENVLTAAAWRALGRVVKPGQEGVSILTVVPCFRRDRASGESYRDKRTRRTSVYHVTQTEPLTPANAPAPEIPAEIDADRLLARACGFESVDAMNAAGYALHLPEPRRARVAEALARSLGMDPCLAAAA